MTNQQLIPARRNTSSGAYAGIFSSGNVRYNNSQYTNVVCSRLGLAVKEMI